MDTSSIKKKQIQDNHDNISVKNPKVMYNKEEENGTQSKELFYLSNIIKG